MTPWMSGATAAEMLGGDGVVNAARPLDIR
jgi:hypothetical protein